MASLSDWVYSQRARGTEGTGSVSRADRLGADDCEPSAAARVGRAETQGSRLARDRAAHAARAAPTGAQLGAGDPDHLDAGVLQPVVGLVVALVGDRDPRCERQGVVAVVPLLPLGGDRVEAGVDPVHRVDAHGRGRGDQERLGLADLEDQVAVGLGVAGRPDRVGHQRVGHVGVDDHLVDVDQRADRVEVHGRAFLRDRYGEHRVREVGLEALPGQPLDAGRRGPLADPDRDHARREQQHVAALDVLEVRAVHPRRAHEPGVPAVDQLGQLGLALAGRHRQRRDRDPVAHPHRRVAGEQQVGQRVDEEVVVRQQRGDQPEPAAHLVVADARGEVRRQLGRARRRRAVPRGSRAWCRRGRGRAAPPRSRTRGRPPARASR